MARSYSVISMSISIESTENFGSTRCIASCSARWVLAHPRVCNHHGARVSGIPYGALTGYYKTLVFTSLVGDSLIQHRSRSMDLVPVGRTQHNRRRIFEFPQEPEERAFSGVRAVHHVFAISLSVGCQERQISSPLSMRFSLLDT